MPKAKFGVGDTVKSSGKDMLKKQGQVQEVSPADPTGFQYRVRDDMQDFWFPEKNLELIEPAESDEESDETPEVPEVPAA